MEKTKSQDQGFSKLLQALGMEEKDGKLLVGKKKHRAKRKAKSTEGAKAKKTKPSNTIEHHCYM